MHDFLKFVLGLVNISIDQDPFSASNESNMRIMRLIIGILLTRVHFETFFTLSMHASLCFAD